MKKISFTFLVVCLCLTMCAGCNNQSSSVIQSSSSAAFTIVASASISSSATFQSTAMSSSSAVSIPTTFTGVSTPLSDPLSILEGVQSWPTSTIYDIPVWEDVTKFYGGGASLDDYINDSYMMNVVATKASLTKYLEKLEIEGYTVHTDESISALQNMLLKKAQYSLQ